MLPSSERRVLGQLHQAAEAAVRGTGLGQVALVSPVSVNTKVSNLPSGAKTPFSGRLNGVAEAALASALASNGDDAVRRSVVNGHPVRGHERGRRCAGRPCLDRGCRRPPGPRGTRSAVPSSIDLEGLEATALGQVAAGRSGSRRKTNELGCLACVFTGTGGAAGILDEVDVAALVVLDALVTAAAGDAGDVPHLQRAPRGRTARRPPVVALPSEVSNRRCANGSHVEPSSRGGWRR